MYQPVTRRIAYSVVVAVLGACSSQVEPTYKGEPLVSAAGSVVEPPAPIDRGPNDRDIPVPTLDTLPADATVAIFWMSGQRDYFTRLGAIQRNGASPRFNLNFFEPPPDATFSFDTNTGEASMAIGVVLLTSPGAWSDPTDPYVPFSSEVWGYSLDSMVLYFPRDARTHGEPELDPVFTAARYYGVAPTRGYHIVRVIRSSAPSANDACRWQLYGRCEDRTWEGTTRLERDAKHLDFQLCQQTFPDQPRCCTFQPCASDLPVCDAAPDPGPGCWVRATNEPNLDNHPVPISITLGATLRDVIY